MCPSPRCWGSPPPPWRRCLLRSRVPRVLLRLLLGLLLGLGAVVVVGLMVGAVGVVVDPGVVDAVEEVIAAEVVVTGVLVGEAVGAVDVVRQHEAYNRTRTVCISLGLRGLTRPGCEQGIFDAVPLRSVGRWLSCTYIPPRI